MDFGFVTSNYIVRCLVHNHARMRGQHKCRARSAAVRACGMKYQYAPNYCLRCCVIVFVSNFTFHYIHQPDPRTIMSLISLTGQHSLSEYDILVIASRAIVAGRIRMYDYPFGAWVSHDYISFGSCQIKIAWIPRVAIASSRHRRSSGVFSISSRVTLPGFLASSSAEDTSSAQC